MDASKVRSAGYRLEIEGALALLEQAQEILDSKKVSPDVGARLQDVIEQVKALDPLT
jgi:hypothetical protein